MTVQELIEQLTEIAASEGGDLQVVLSKDGEGNSTSFSPLSDSDDSGDFYTVGAYCPDSAWSGDCFHSDSDVTDECESDNHVRALVLWPTN